LPGVSVKQKNPRVVISKVDNLSIRAWIPWREESLSQKEENEAEREKKKDRARDCRTRRAKQARKRILSDSEESSGQERARSLGRG